MFPQNCDTCQAPRRNNKHHNINIYLLEIPTSYTEYIISLLYSHVRLTTGWTVWRSNPSEGEIFRTRSERPWTHPAGCAMGAESLSRD